MNLYKTNHCNYIKETIHIKIYRIYRIFNKNHKELEIGKRLIFTTMSQSWKIQSPNGTLLLYR